MTEISVAVRFWRRVDAMMAQGEGLLPTFRQLLERTIFHRPTLTFVAAGMRRRTEAVMPYAELAVGAVSRLVGHFRRRKTLAVATGARGAGTDATLAASASAPKEDLDDGFPVQSTGSALMQSSDLVGASDNAPSSELTQTFVQTSREPIPLPGLRSR
jgi:hypothetical protein